MFIKIGYNILLSLILNFYALKMKDKNESDSEPDQDQNEVYSQESSSDDQIYGEEVEIKPKSKMKKT